MLTVISDGMAKSRNTSYAGAARAKQTAEIFAEGKKENKISALFHGAHYCPMEFDGDTSLIE